MSCPVTFRSMFIPIFRPSVTALPRMTSTRSIQSAARFNAGPDILSRAAAPMASAKPVAPMASAEPTTLKEWDSIISQTNFDPAAEEYHLHIYSHKHNTHITFTDPNKQPIVSLSTGNIGFRKSHRGTYDAAYQLAAHVFAKIEDKKIRPKNMEVILRDFGEGREAVLKALLGTEGRYLKTAIKRVTDSTRLKFGGTKSRKPRRLG